MGQREEIKNNRDYWKKIIGADVCDTISEEESTLELPIEYRKEYTAVKACFNQALSETEGWEDYKLDALFGEFFQIFGRIATIYGKGKHLDILKNREQTILSNFYHKIGWIPLRVLIQDIHRCKDQGWLNGEDSQKEYQDYCQRFLGDRQYVKALCEEYPEMTKLLLMQIVNHVLFIEEIACAVERDKEKLEKRFFEGKTFNYIEQIACGQSDAHRRGRTVANVSFDNGCRLVYKPRSLGKESHYEELYEIFCEQAGLSYEKVLALDCGTYGWQAFVSRRVCADPEAVGRYFERMGILLFLCYCMNAMDIHGENIIADGEYPVLIDLEAFPGTWKKQTPHSAEELIREELKASVLSTGILPVAMWGQDGHGVILNALHGNQKEKAPFQIPVVHNPKSSDIQIGYRRGEIQLSGSLPCCNGMNINPADYTREICTGFEKAYRYWLEHKEELYDRFQVFFSFESRYLLRHTQQYSMLLQMSYYPEFLESEDKRRLFFHVLDKRNTSERRQREFLAYERNALYQMDIPFFYVKGDGRELYDGEGKVYPGVLDAPAFLRWQEKQELMGEVDLKKQLRFIELSLALLGKYHKEGPKPKKCKKTLLIEDCRAVLIEKILDKICNLAVVYEEKDVNFSGLRFQDESSWSIAPMGMYLYDGMAGVAVFMAAAREHYWSSACERVWQLVIQKLFRYTERLENKGRAESEHIGAFVGEGSIVNAYLLLYEITNDAVFVEYAKRHVVIVMDMAEKEVSMDLLSGCAGAIVVLLKLYRIVGKEAYLAWARSLEEKLWQNIVHLEEGSGWPLIKDGKPLAGMAHGNSGLLLAYAYLMEAAPENRYLERIRELLRYENSLYDEEMGNWKDLRHGNGERISSNAWCHGASGILIARLKLKQLEGLKNDPQIERDIERCREILLQGRNPQEVCLCHGLAGDYLALELYAEHQGVPDIDLEEAREAALVQLIEKMEDEDVLRVQERENISLMVGIVGGCFAICEINEKCFLLL